MDRTLKAVMLHGFLGSHGDWSLVLRALADLGIKADVICPDFFKPGPLSAAHSFEEWTSNLTQEVERRFGNEKIHLLGYSLGGRLGFHAALAQPSRWESLWFFAANPGILKGSKEDRLRWEDEWKAKFLGLPWPELMRAWNGQDVFFQSTPRLEPSEQQLDRELLAASFTNWSLTHHLFDLERLNSLPVDTEWWFGEADTKFLDVKRELERQNIKGRYRVIENAGHRLTLDQPRKIADAIADKMGYEK